MHTLWTWKLILCYIDCMLKNKTKKMRFFSMKINPFNNLTKPSEGKRFFSVECADLIGAQRPYRQECFWIWLFTQAKSIPGEKPSI